MHEKSTPLLLKHSNSSAELQRLMVRREYEVTKLVGAIIYSHTQSAQGGREKGPPRHTHDQRLQHVLSVGVYLLRKLLGTWTSIRGDILRLVLLLWRWESDHPHVRYFVWLQWRGVIFGAVNSHSAYWILYLIYLIENKVDYICKFRKLKINIV